MSSLEQQMQPPGQTWWDIIEAHARRFPERDALAHGDGAITYGELVARVRRCAAGLSARGIGAGDCVALLAPPTPDAMVCLLAAARLGALWVGLNPRYQAREMAYVIGHAQPKLVLSVREFEARRYADDLEAALATPAPQARRPELLYYDSQASCDEAMLHALCDAPDAACPAPFDDAAQPCMLVYTSGTTGNPKGVLLSQTALIYRSTVQARTFATRSHPVVINFAPINHIGGMHFRGLSQILADGTIIYQERYRPAEVMGLIEKHRVNMLMLGSTMLQMLIREPSFDMSIMRGMEWFIFSGAAIPMPILQRVKEHCPRIGSTYGLTESCGSVSYIVASDSLEAAAYTVGRAIPEGQLRVADEQGQPLPAGTQGELQVRGQYCMNGYLRDAAATAGAFTRDGWLKTGDMAQREDDGNFRLVGRIKEMYKSGGYNVYPREIEVVLEQHPNVLMSAVIAVDDELYQQVGHAHLILRPDTEVSEPELVQWCRERMANYKVPKRIFVRNSLPMLSIGKVDKIALRQQH